MADRHFSRAHDGTTTSGALLRNVRDWRDMPAWQEFFRRYDRHLRRWCRTQALSTADSDDVRQQIWIELAKRMKTYQYDPQRSFRGWLRTLCRSRIIDYLRLQHRERHCVRTFNDSAFDQIINVADSSLTNSEDDLCEERIPQDALVQAEAVQAAVRRRVQPRTWEIFWLIAIADRPIGEVAANFKMTYAAAFEAYARVRRLLRAEGDRYPGNPGDSSGGHAS